MLAPADPALRARLLDWMGAREEARFIGQEEAQNEAGEATLVCVLVDEGVAEHRASSATSWEDAVRNCLGIAISAERTSNACPGLASLEGLKVLVLVRKTK
jgi:hypothetical protein